MTTVSDLTLIRAGHTEVADGQCGLCDVPWPCDTGVVLAALAAAEARAEQAERERDASIEVIALAYEGNDRLRSRLATVEAALLHRCVVQRVEPTCEDCQTIIAALAATPAAEHVDLIPPMPARESFDATIVIDEFRRGTPHIYADEAATPATGEVE